MSIKFNYSEVTHTGNKRKNNEDSHFSKQTPNGFLFVLCDGMGGAAAGEIASATTVKTIFEHFDIKKYVDIPLALKSAVSKANAILNSKSKDDSSLSGMGTTVCITLINDNDIFIAHVGDSRIYLISDNQIYNLTRDHSKVNEYIESGIISEEERFSHPEKNVILKAIGTDDMVIPDISNPIKLKSGDQILMCSDGLNDMIHDSLILKILSSDNQKIDKKAHDLVEAALENGGKDNITVQLIEILQSPHDKSVFIDKSYIKKSIPITEPNNEKKNFILPLLLSALFILFGYSLYKFYPILSQKYHEIVNKEGNEEKIDTKTSKAETSHKILLKDVLKSANEKKALDETEELLKKCDIDDYPIDGEKLFSELYKISKINSAYEPKIVNKAFDWLKKQQKDKHYSELIACENFLKYFPHSGKKEAIIELANESKKEQKLDNINKKSFPTLHKILNSNSDKKTSTSTRNQQKYYTTARGKKTSTPKWVEEYTIKAGETLLTVARKFLTLSGFNNAKEFKDALCKYNELKDCNILKAGDSINMIKHLEYITWDKKNTKIKKNKEIKETKGSVSSSNSIKQKESGVIQPTGQVQEKTIPIKNSTSKDSSTLKGKGIIESVVPKDSLSDKKKDIPTEKAKDPNVASPKTDSLKKPKGK